MAAGILIGKRLASDRKAGGSLSPQCVLAGLLSARVTLGPATAALYRTVARCIRGSERKSWSLFFRTFRENFKVGALTTLVVVAVGAVLFVLYIPCSIRLHRSTAPATSCCAHASVFLLLPPGPAVLPLSRPLPV